MKNLYLATKPLCSLKTCVWARIVVYHLLTPVQRDLNNIYDFIVVVRTNPRFFRLLPFCPTKQVIPHGNIFEPTVLIVIYNMGQGLPLVHPKSGVSLSAEYIWGIHTLDFEAQASNL